MSLLQTIQRAVAEVAPNRAAAVALLAILATTGSKMLQETLELPVGGALPFALAAVAIVWLVARFTQLTQHWAVWAVMALCTGVYLVVRWPGPANHTYVFGYMCVALAMTGLSASEHRQHVLRTNMQGLMLAIMAFAVLQKAITPGYLDGTINAFWLATGGYGRPLWTFSEGWQAVVRDNMGVLNEYYNVNQQALHELTLQSPMENLRLAGKILACVILGSEVVLPAIFVWKRAEIGRHIALLLFVPGVFLMRQESGFLSLLCVMGIACWPAKPAIRWAYVAYLVILQVLFLLQFGYI